MPDLAIVLLWLLAGGCIVWAGLPPLATVLGLSRLGFVLDEDPIQAAEPNGDAPLAARLRELAALGFRPVGTACEIGWLFWFHWRWQSPPQRLSALPDGSSFAVLYRLWAGDEVRVCFETYLSEEGRVVTALPGAGHQKLRDNRLRVEVQGLSAAETFARHQEHVAHFRQRQMLQPVQITLRERMEYEMADSSRDLWSLGSLSAFLLPTLSFALPACGAWLLLERSGWAQQAWSMPTAIIAGGAAYLLTLTVIVPRSLAQEAQATWEPRAGG